MLRGLGILEKGTQEKMTDINIEIICCPFCIAPITVDEVGEHVSANPDTKKQGIEEQFQL